MVCWDIWGCLISVSKQQFSVFKHMYQTALNAKIFESFDGNALNIYIGVCIYRV